LVPTGEEISAANLDKIPSVLIRLPALLNIVRACMAQISKVAHVPIKSSVRLIEAGLKAFCANTETLLGILNV
jgi:hypothetical protein